MRMKKKKQLKRINPVYWIFNETQQNSWFYFYYILNLISSSLERNNQMIYWNFLLYN